MSTAALPDSLARAPADRGRRVLLVDANEEIARHPQLYLAPLGLLAVNAGLRAHVPNLESRILDWGALADDDREAVLDRLLADFRPAVVGISSFSANLPLAQRIARHVREHDARIPVILGGQHATVLPDGIGRYPQFDYYVVGEGVLVAPRLVEALLSGGDPSSVPSLAYRRGGTVARTPLAPHPASMDDYPPVDWADLDVARYRDHDQSALVQDPVVLRSLRGQFLPAIASKGCTYDCGFCERPWGAPVRTFSHERVLSDIARMQDVFGSSVVLFLDAFIHGRRRWFEELLGHLQKRFPNTLFAAEVRADRLDRALVDRMVAAGFRFLQCFPESGSPRIRERMKKQLDIDRFRTAMEHASSQGVLTQGSFLLGWPGETVEDAEASIAFGAESFFDFVCYYPLVYLAGADVSRHLAGVGIQPDTPAYFEHLRHPDELCLAAYGNETYHRLVVEGRALNAAKLASPGTRAKLQSLGLQAEMGIGSELQTTLSDAGGLG